MGGERLEVWNWMGRLKGSGVEGRVKMQSENHFPGYLGSQYTNYCTEGASIKIKDLINVQQRSGAGMEKVKGGNA